MVFDVEGIGAASELRWGLTEPPPWSENTLPFSVRR